MCLQDLRLYECAATAEEYEPLASLPALQRLSFTRCLELPDCLGRLPRLRLLSIYFSPLITFDEPEDEEELDESRAALLDSALSMLSSTAQLTQLQLADYGTLWPPALTSLRGLQVLGLERHRFAEPLPTGPWLRSLRWAALTAEVAATALPALSAATQLQGLAVWSYASRDQLQPILPDIIAWAAQQRPLRMLEIEPRTSSGREAAQSLQAAIERAQQAAPALQVQFGCRLQKRLLFYYDSPSIKLCP